MGQTPRTAVHPFLNLGTSTIWPSGDSLHEEHFKIWNHKFLLFREKGNKEKKKDDSCMHICLQQNKQIPVIGSGSWPAL